MILSLLLLISLPLQALPIWQSDLSSALDSAKHNGSLVLLDFSAPWCYSCYYMEQHVLREPEMDSFTSKLKFVGMNVDSREGKRLQEKYFVRMLPTYVVLNSDGTELGRISGEQTKELFFSQLHGLVSQGSPLERLEQTARQGGADAASAGAQALHLYAQRRQAAEGLKLFEALAPETQAKIQSDPAGRLEVLRLRLQSAEAAKDVEICSRMGRLLMLKRTDCEVMYDLDDQQQCLSDLPVKRLQSIYSLERDAVDGMLRRRIFVPVPGRCADFRTGVEVAVDFYKAMGERKKASSLLAKAIGVMRSELGGNVGLDRNKADNLRAFYELAGKNAELAALYPSLIASYPDDYVYPYRYGKFLLKQGKAREALEPLDKAQHLSSGAGSLLVADVRARVFAKLGRKDDARREIENALKSGSESFSQETEQLQKTQKELKL